MAGEQRSNGYYMKRMESQDERAVLRWKKREKKENFV